VEATDIDATRKHITGEQEPALLEAIEGFVAKLNGQEIATLTARNDDGYQEVVWYTDKYYCANCNIQYPEFTSQHFSANRQEGACARCHGMGEVLQADFDKILDPYAVYLQAILPWRDSNYGQAILKKLGQKYDINERTYWKDLPEWFREVVINGDDELLRVNT
jgi:excinuclease UvrABC ATPase subunit